MASWRLIYLRNGEAVGQFLCVLARRRLISLHSGELEVNFVFFVEWRAERQFLCVMASWRSISLRSGDLKANFSVLWLAGGLFLCVVAI
jgi:hypothetical protein